jgi:hypothetical protein
MVRKIKRKKHGVRHRQFGIGEWGVQNSECGFNKETGERFNGSQGSKLKAQRKTRKFLLINSSPRGRKPA